MPEELGYHTLLTYFTGASSATLSGTDVFPMSNQDTGTANTLNNDE